MSRGYRRFSSPGVPRAALHGCSRPAALKGPREKKKEKKKGISTEARCVSPPGLRWSAMTGILRSSLDCRTDAAQGGMRVQQGQGAAGRQLARQRAQPPRVPWVRASNRVLERLLDRSRSRPAQMLLSSDDAAEAVVVAMACGLHYRMKKGGRPKQFTSLAGQRRPVGVTLHGWSSPRGCFHRLGRRSISRKGLLSFVVMTSCFLFFFDSAATQPKMNSDCDDATCTLRWDHRESDNGAELLRLLRAHASTLRLLHVA